MKKAVIAVPMGDPAGIGPEIVVKAVSKKEIQDIAKVVVIGDGKILEKAVEICKVPIHLKKIEKVEDLMDIVRLGVMTTPSVMVDGKLIISGRVPKVKDIVKLLS